MLLMFSERNYYILSILLFLCISFNVNAQYRNNIFQNDISLFSNNTHSADYYSKLKSLNVKSIISLDYKDKVCLYIDAYLDTHKPKTERILGLSEIYFPIFEKYLKMYNLPDQLKYVAVIESALRNRATSKSGARGLWQFMYTTGRMFKLKINPYVDERYDVDKSTQAACKYFRYLYGIFEDWHLVIAAYNSGPGTVSKAIERARGAKDFWLISEYLPLQTRNYIPAFIAVNYVFEYFEDYELSVQEISNIYNVRSTPISINKQISLEYLAECLNLEYDLIKRINPIYEQYIIPATELPAIIYIPEYKLAEFNKKKKKIYSRYYN